MTQYYTVVWTDKQGRKIANPHVTDIRFGKLPNGDACVRLKNPHGDDGTINLEMYSIEKVNNGFFNLEGADYAYHKGLPANEATAPNRNSYVEDSTSFFE